MRFLPRGYKIFDLAFLGLDNYPNHESGNNILFDIRQYG